jgi:hypothetical protein
VKRFERKFRIQREIHNIFTYLKYTETKMLPRKANIRPNTTEGME